MLIECDDDECLMEVDDVECLCLRAMSIRTTHTHTYTHTYTYIHTHTHKLSLIVPPLTIIHLIMYDVVGK
jgi:hypothetical protein